MSRPAASRLSYSLCAASPRRSLVHPLAQSSRLHRAFSSTSFHLADDVTSKPPRQSGGGSGSISSGNRGPPSSEDVMSVTDQINRLLGPSADDWAAEAVTHESLHRYRERPAHKLHIYSHRHNTHITLGTPEGNVMLSLSAGNIGARKANRGTFDAGFQLTSYFLAQIREKGWLRDIERLEVYFRGFGSGREAASKAILGSEGQAIQNKIVKVGDTTRIKFGGTRSRAPRRLG
ncbi:hypothetical protein BDY21DRAFT_334288 [Lineolata rhizophorae]|uniref:Translational machinery component n=1 Tax=Lineolata rhizophorae TaxID=578093 RepID=A0A6A6PAX6_9PEZI|nr:hypothetical protein BDY21DRAFT_334288 [Lineolata rhizophorae]